MIIALAGRRSFPPGSIQSVRERLRTLLQQQHADAIVSSAACGADLLALEEAGALGLRRRVILGSDPEHFRQTSVVDHPGGWGAIYDRVLEEVKNNGDLIVLNSSYAAVNSAILDEAIAMAQKQNTQPIALILWDARRRGKQDLTQAFLEEAKTRGLSVLEMQITEPPMSGGAHPQ